MKDKTREEVEAMITKHTAQLMQRFHKLEARVDKLEKAKQ